LEEIPKAKKMKRILKFIGYGIGAIFLASLIGVLYIGISGIPKYETKNIEYQASKTPEAIEHGRKIAIMLCANCHMDKETGKLTEKKCVMLHQNLAKFILKI
jgi:hypothetical protein